MNASESHGKKRAKELVRALNLKHLNLESGLFNVLSVSDIEVQAGDGKSPASNVIYLMLTKEVSQNFLQCLYSDDCHVLIEGGPADYYLFYEDGRAEKFTLDRDLRAGQQLIVPSPGGTAKAIVLHDSTDYLLAGSIVTPAWSPPRVRIGADEAFIEKYAGKADWATPEFIKFLIGPNFGKMEGARSEALQIIWQGMQLTGKQLRAELKKFGENDNAHSLKIEVSKDAPPESVEKAKELIARAGITFILREQSSIV